MCTVPSERYNHGTAYFDDGLIYIYGGISQRCADYCDDMWAFDIYVKNWRQVYGEGELTQLDGFMDSYGKGGPGKRWKMGMQATGDTMVIFGGHRLWHGYSSVNSEANDWSDYSEFQYGGYLNDFWIYTKELDFTTIAGDAFKSTTGNILYIFIDICHICV